MIDRIVLENFRCFGPRLEVSLGQFNVLTGPNDSGKSAFLDAFLFFRDCEIGSDQYMALPRGGYVNTIEKDLDRSGSGDYRCSVQIHDHSGARERGVVMDPDGDGKPTIGGPVPRQDRLVVETFRPVPSRIAMPAWPYDNSHIDPDGYGVSSALAWLEARYPARVREIEEILETAFPTILGSAIEDDRSKNSARQRDQLLFHRGAEQGPLRASDAPEGLLVFLAYVTRRFVGFPPAILLLEYPERYFHVSLFTALVKQLRAMSTPGDYDSWQTPPQVIITTYSPYLLDHCAYDELLLCYRPSPSAPAVVKPVAADPKWRASLEEYMVGEAVTLLGEETLAEPRGRSVARARFDSLLDRTGLAGERHE